MAIVVGAYQAPAERRSSAFLPRSRFRQTRPARQVTAERQAATRSPLTRSEQFIAGQLNYLRIAWTYEPEMFATGLTGKGKQGIRPDFWIPEFQLFIEVTEAADEDRKRQKIRGAERRHGVRILLIGRNELRQLQQGQVTLLALIRACIQEEN